MAWVEGIGKLYALNDARLAVRQQPAAFADADAALRGAVTALAAQGEAELADPQVHPARRRVLESLGDHWTGLTVFVEHPEVPMDNNKAERVQRGPVVGRKNYYGSGAVWAGRLAAMMFSLFQTLTLWNINPRLWLTAYLEACATAGGKRAAGPREVSAVELDRGTPQGLVLERGRRSVDGHVVTTRAVHRPHSPRSRRAKAPGNGDCAPRFASRRTEREDRMFTLLREQDMHVRDFRSAVDRLEELTRLRRNANDWGRLGACYMKLNRLDRALPALEKALSIQPYLPILHAILARTYSLLGDRGRAAEHRVKADWLTRYSQK